MEKKYQIFISSTYDDLIEERKKVQDTILFMYHFPIGMEMFSAANEEQWEIIQETINSSDYYVLIIGHRYGSTIEEGDDVGISYTEKEYKYAKEKGVPILAFIIDDSVMILPKNMDIDNDKKRRLTAFIQDVKTGRMIQWWENKDDLANKVMNSLNKQISRVKRPGWVRADLFSVEETQKMSKKIRQLEEENAELKRQVVIRKPDLIMTINDLDNLQISFSEKSLDYVDVDFMPLSMEKVPDNLRGKITQNELDNYNRSLPNNEELERYKNELQFYYQALNHSIDISLKVYNKGTLKAKDVCVEIKFPNEITVYKKTKLKDLRSPQKPSKGVNPIENYFIDREKIGKAAVPNILPRVNIFDMDAINQMDSKYRHFYNSDNTISLRLDDLLNSYTWSVENEYCIIPTKKGMFEIKCNFMCEEYCEVETQIIKISVV